MTEFHERPFMARYGMMGDKAEGAFTTVFPNAHRLGLNRPNMSMAKMTATMRYAPDYMTEDAAYEVMGFSSRGNSSLKLKCEKLDALQAWALLMPVRLWVYDSAKNKYYNAPIGMWANACYDHGERCYFPDNHRPYWNLSSHHFPTPCEVLP